MGIPNQPLVTVYIPTYNRIKLLKRAVKSVQDQTYKNLEIIIVDDCSTDGTHEYLEQLAKDDKRVRYFLKEINSGACVSRNIAIENATGEFITGLDDDDYYDLNRINEFVKSTQGHDMNKIIFFSMYKNIEDKSFLKKIIKLITIKRNVNKEDLLYNNYIGNQVFVKTVLLKSIGGFDVNLKMWQDLDCWYNLLSNNRQAKCIQSTYYFLDTVHNSKRISNANHEKLITTYNYFCKKHNLDEIQSKYLKIHFLNYGVEGVGLKILCNRFLRTFNLIDFFYVLKFIKQKLF